MRSLRSAAGSQLHQQARRKTSLLRVPGGQEGAAGLPAAAGARGGSCAVVARAPGTERNRCGLRLRAASSRCVLPFGHPSRFGRTRRCHAFGLLLTGSIRPGVRRTGEEAPFGGRTPRISRLMALAIRFDGLLSRGAVRNRRELAEAGQVSRARLSQILQLNHLAPEIQEQLLFLPPTRRGPDPLL